MNITLIFIIISLVTTIGGGAAIRGCLSERDKVTVLQAEKAGLEAENQRMIRVIQASKEAREAYEKTKNEVRDPGLVGDDLDRKFDQLFPKGGGIPPGSAGAGPGKAGNVGSPQGRH